MQICDNFDPTKITTFSQISSRYQPISFLGKGAAGTVIKVLDKQELRVLALKLNVNKKEIQIACNLQAIRGKTDSIFQILDMAAFNMNLSYDPYTNILVEGSKLSYIDYVLTMPVYQEYYDPKKEYQMIDHMGVYFEICVALKSMHNAGYYHGDLKTRGNIMLQKVDYKRIYNINGEQYEIDNYLMPVIIDFGLANSVTRNLIPEFTESSAGDDFYYLYKFYFQHSMDIPNTDLEWLRASILVTPMFDKFNKINLMPGDKYKMFEPVYYGLRFLEDDATEGQINAYNYVSRFN